jgi:hypothetical protein
MKILENYKSWPRRAIKIGYGDWAEENLYISEIIGEGISQFARKTNLYPTHISIGLDCRHEVQRQVNQSLMFKYQNLGEEIYGMKIIWSINDGISLLFSPE